MKKWVLAILTGAIVLTASLYVFIPDKITIQKSVVIKISPKAITRLLMDNSNWDKWWPDNDTGIVKNYAGQSFLFNGLTYSIVDKKYSSVLLDIYNKKDSLTTSSLNIVAIWKDSVKLDWEALIATSTNPKKRLQQWLAAKKMRNDMGTLLNKMTSFFSGPSNVYGINIRKESVMDSTLISTHDSCKGYPKTAFIYSLINNLQNHIAINNAKITGFPMLNIYTRDSIIYIAKVALPVDKKLPPGNKIAYKWMLPHGNILVTDVKGDAKAVDRAFEQMEFFIKDYELAAPAIPFLSLVTNRMYEKDSTKWVTRIYYPVMDL